MAGRREELVRALGELARALRDVGEAVGEVRRSVLRAVEEALGVPLSPETRGLMELYDLSPPPQPGLDELREMVARSLGFEGYRGDLLELLRGLGASGSGSESAGARGEEAARAGEEAGGKGEG